MSADNWTRCPKCVQQRAAEHAKQLEKLAKDYGKVPAEDYERRRAAIPARPPTPPETLREDYELRTDAEGTFEVSYSCSCTACGFRWSFKDSRDVLGRVVSAI